MVDFRKMIPVLAVIAFLLGSVSTASAQSVTPTMSCFANGGTNTPVRSEGLTELVGDVQINCTNGTPTAPGAAIPTVNIQIFLNTGVTSRLMGGASAYSEALLILDEPVPGVQYGCGAQTCSAVGNGIGGGPTVPYYGAGTVGTAGNNRNIFQGIQTTTNSITFLGIPIDPPGTSGQRLIRITNVRGNANALGVAGSNATPTAVIETITATPFNFLPVSNPVQTVGSVQKGLAFSVSNVSPFNGVLQQCVSRSTGATAIATLKYTELFATSFKRRNIATGDGTAQSVSGASTPLSSAEQNDLRIGTYNTESGFTTGALSGATTLPSMTAGGYGIGQADFGTRLKAVFNNIPNGISLFVSISADANGGFDRAFLTSSETGAFAAVGATSSSPAGSALLTLGNNSATAVWEVVNSQATSFAVFNFNVWASYTASPATNSPALSSGTVNGSYAPTSTVTTASSGPIPRFQDTSTATPLLTVVPCVTNLLFPYITTQFGFDTGVAISNTSTDPFKTSAQSGTCTLNWYGAAFTGATPTDNVPSGTTWTGLSSSILSNVTNGFTGYMIAVCRFQFAHGFAFVSDFGARNLAMGYLALIIPDPARSNGPSPFAPGLGFGSGEQLGY